MFGSKARRITDAAPPPPTALEVLQQRVDHLEHELAALSEKVGVLDQRLGELNEIDIEWQSFHEKFSTLYARLSKRAERAAADVAPPPPEPTPNPAALKLLGI